jgi:hypothetical protein
LFTKTSRDLKAWDPAVDDVSYDTYTARPGMITVVLLPNDQYIMTYE